MAARMTELPTQEQCFALTDEQCKRIQDIRDPDGTRNYKNWEQQHQMELIRLYMTMLSFPHIEQAMRSKLDWSYKTYANRFKDWRFPVDRAEREQNIIDLYKMVADSSNPPTPAPDIVVPITSPPSVLAIRPLRHPTPIPPAVIQRAQAYTAPTEYHFPAVSPMPEEISSNFYDRMPHDRMSIATTNTWASGSSKNTNLSGVSSVYPYNDDLYSQPRSSNTSISSMSTHHSGSHYSSYQQPQPQQHQRMPVQYQAPRPSHSTPAKHDPISGRWNSTLRVIPCRRDHSQVQWHDETFVSCLVCGFSRWHSLMLNSRDLSIEVFVAAMNHLREVSRVDFAGNYPIHFLMTAGVRMDYFEQLYRWPSSSAQNVFGQNPLHVLNPRDLGESLVSFLEWFKTRETPPGLLLTQRDISCRTPLHTLFQHPIDRSLIQRVIKVFPYAEHQLRSLDNSGRTCIQMMNEASLIPRDACSNDYEKIQAGIAEVSMFLNEAALTSPTPPGPRYGFHDIARGARGTSYYGFFQCRICYQTNAHSNSYLDQLKCACKNGRDRNAPDESGMTPAHALVTLSRANSDDNQTSETPAQTAELLEVLIPREEHTMREALHVLDPDGNSLVWNAAVRGLDVVLAYILSVEEVSRRRAMVNCVGVGVEHVPTIGANGKPEPIPQDNREVSVLEAVIMKLRAVRNDLKATEFASTKTKRRELVERGNRLLRVRTILVANGAVVTPGPTMKWRIC